MQEKEVWGKLENKSEFKKKLFEYKGEFGEPNIKVRLSIEINDYDDKYTDTRIRITNGESVIMQKVGKWDGSGIIDRKEIEVKIPPDSKEILKYYKILSNQQHSANLQRNIIQSENYIFITKDFELKLTHQFGKSHIYHFEVEGLEAGLDIVESTKGLGLKPNLEPKGEDFWKSHNKKINIDPKDLSEFEFLRLIQKYLK